MEDLGLNRELPNPEVIPPSNQSQSQNEAQAGSTTDGGEWTPELLADFGATLLDGFVTRAYRAPLTDVERIACSKSFTPLCRKWFAGTVAPEWVALGTVAMVVLPRHLMGPAAPAEENTSRDSDSARAQGNGQESTPSPTHGRAVPALDDLLRGGA